MKLNKKGQSLIEFLIAMGIFVLLISGLSLLIIDSYLSHRVSRERTKAIFLAEEGIEAVRSIRDADWDALTLGNHGLEISSNNWSFSSIQEDISEQLNEGTRTIIVEEDENCSDSCKKISCLVNWKLNKAREQEISISTYLASWGTEGGFQTSETFCQSLGYSTGQCTLNVNQCEHITEGTYESEGDQYCSSPPNINCCCYE